MGNHCRGPDYAVTWLANCKTALDEDSYNNLKLYLEFELTQEYDTTTIRVSDQETPTTGGNNELRQHHARR